MIRRKIQRTVRTCNKSIDHTVDTLKTDKGLSLKQEQSKLIHCRIEIKEEMPIFTQIIAVLNPDENIYYFTL